MRHKLVIDGNAVYEIDDDCLGCRQKEETARKEGCSGSRRKEAKRRKKEVGCGQNWKNE